MPHADSTPEQHQEEEASAQTDGERSLIENVAMRPERTSPDNGFFLSGRVTIRPMPLFSRTIPIVIHACDDGVTFAMRRARASAKTLSYDQLHMAAISNFLGRKKVIIYAETGVEAIRCSESTKKISDFCKFVNEKIASLHEKPLGPKYQLTQLQVPPESRLQALEQVPEGHDAALDLLFHPDKFDGDFLDRIAREFTINHPKQKSGDAKPKEPGNTRRRRQSARYDLFSRHDEKIWNLSPSRARLREIFLGICVLALGAVALWQLGELPGTEPESQARIDARHSSTASPEPAPRPDELAPGEQPRALAQLVGIVADDGQYQELIETLKRERMKLGVSTKELGKRLRWDEQRIIEIESQISRAEIMEIIDYALAMRKDIHELLGSIN